MTRIIATLDEISSGYDALFCDLWGCLHNGIAAFPEAVAALMCFREKGGRVVLLTNAPRPARAIAAMLDRLDVPREAWDIIVTSGDAAQDGMFAGAVGRKVWHLGPRKDHGFFEDIPPEWSHAAPIERVPLEEAEGIVCTGLFDELAEVPEDYRPRLMLARGRGMIMLCANPDVVVDKGVHRLYCAGALAHLYEELGGRTLYFGKPHPPIYDLARRKLGAVEKIDDSRILAVGDGINTDVSGAAVEGFDSLFITGGLAAGQFGDDPLAPEADRLETWLGMRQQLPTFTMGMLR